MMKRIFILIILALLLPPFAAGKEPAKQITADTIQVMKIAAQDERAIIKTPDGKMQIIKVGDPIGDHAKVVEIAKDRVVIQEMVSKNDQPDTVIIRLVDGKQKVERIKKIADKQQARPVSLPVTTGQKSGNK